METSFGKPELVVYYGPMFSRKTKRFIDDMESVEIAEKKYQAFKPYIDDRGEGQLVIRSKKRVGSNVYLEIPATPIHEPGEILKVLNDNVALVGIDEAQFLDNTIFPIVREIIYKRGIPVVISGLPTDFRDEPFGPMPGLISKADRAVQFFAICKYRDSQTNQLCGDEKATKTQRIINGEPALWDSPVILVGKEELYEPRCGRHHIVPGRPY